MRRTKGSKGDSLAFCKNRFNLCPSSAGGGLRGRGVSVRILCGATGWLTSQISLSLGVSNYRMDSATVSSTTPRPPQMAARLGHARNRLCPEFHGQFSPGSASEKFFRSAGRLHVKGRTGHGHRALHLDQLLRAIKPKGGLSSRRFPRPPLCRKGTRAFTSRHRTRLGLTRTGGVRAPSNDYKNRLAASASLADGFAHRGWRRLQRTRMSIRDRNARPRLRA